MFFAFTGETSINESWDRVLSDSVVYDGRNIFDGNLILTFRSKFSKFGNGVTGDGLGS